MTHTKSARTPLGLWQYFPESGLNVLDTDIKAERWQPLNVSIAITGRCFKGCPFCYASSTKAGMTHWRYAELVDFISDLDQNGVFSITLSNGAHRKTNDMTTNPGSRMTMLTARIDAATLAAFDAFAEGRGGRSVVLRQLVEQAARENVDAPRVERRESTASNRVSLRFTDVENAVLEHRASQRSTDRSGWIKALVRRHLGLKSRVDDGLIAELAPIRMQLLRIGRNLNQAMKAANASMLPDGDKQIGGELRRIADMRMEVSEQVAAVGEAMRGDTSYWAVAD